MERKYFPPRSEKVCKTKELCIQAKTGNSNVKIMIDIVNPWGRGEQQGERGDLYLGGYQKSCQHWVNDKTVKTKE